MVSLGITPVKETCGLSTALVKCIENVSWRQVSIHHSLKNKSGLCRCFGSL